MTYTIQAQRQQIKKAQTGMGWGDLSAVGNAIASATSGSANKGFFEKMFNQAGGIKGVAGSIGGIVQGIKNIGEAKKKTKELEGLAEVSNLQARAAATTPEPIKKMYNRPEMYASRPGELFPYQGTGYDAGFAAKHGATVKAQDGMQIGGNPTEIQNMYNPGDLYSNLGYEPLSESDIVKQYEEGGIVPKAKLGAGEFGQIGTSVFNAVMGASPESNLGGKIGSLGGPAFGVLGTMAGKILGANREGREKNAQARMKANTERIAGIQQGQGIQSQYSSYMEDGGTIPYAEEGWVSHNWQPQVIAKWGDINVEDVDDIFRPADMRTLEYGGPVKAQGGMNLPYPNYEQRVERFRDIMSKYSEQELNRRATTEAGLTEYAKLYPNEPFTKEDIGFFQDYTTKVLDPQTQAFMQRRGADWKPGTQRSGTDAIWGPLTQKQPFATAAIKPLGSSEFVELGNVREGFSTSGIDASGVGSMKGMVPSKINIGGKQVAVDFTSGKPFFRNPSTGDMAPYDPSKYHADTGKYYRTGGNIRQNNMSELDQYAFGGSLKTHWGGRAEVDSYNPYLPGTGETVMFKGNQHSESDGTGKTGIGVSYGPKEHDSYTDYAEYGSEQAADVEVENGEPAAQLPDDNGDLSMTVYGAIKANKDDAKEIGDPKAEGITFKNLVKGYNEKEKKATKVIDKANEDLEDLQVVTPFDRLKFNSLQATIQGKDKELQKIATQKMMAANIQNDKNEIADKYGVDVNTLDKKKLKLSKDMNTAKYGINKAQKGNKSKKQSSAIPPEVKLSLQTIDKLTPEQISDRRRREILEDLPTEAGEIPALTAKTKTTEKSKTDWLDVAKTIAGQLPGMLRKPYDEAFDYQQTLPERAALAMNQLEPVDVQLLQPLLTQPFQVSLEDQKAQIKSSYANARRMAANDPSAQAIIAAKESEDLNRINAEEFRMNQGIMAESANKNREILNAYQQANAAALNQQYERMAGAKSKTKATYLEALKSIVDKEVKHKADMRTLAAYSNLFPQYGFDRNMMAFSQLPTWFQKGIVGSTQEAEEKETKKEKTAKNGLKKQLKNGSIVKSLKNI